MNKFTKTNHIVFNNLSRQKHTAPSALWASKLGDTIAMEIGCVWLRRIRFRPTSLASPSPPIPSSPTRPERTSLIFPTPLRISSSRRRSLSAATASSSSPNPLVPADLDFYFEEGINGTQAPTKSSKVLLKGMTYSELEVPLSRSLSLSVSLSLLEN